MEDSEIHAREFDQTIKRVNYNNSWHSVGVWMDSLQNDVINGLKENKWPQIFVPILFEKDAVQVLFKEAKLNRLVSILLDMNDVLPLHPDLSFDIVWRTFEIALHMYHKEFDRQSSSKSLTESERIAQQNRKDNTPVTDLLVRVSDSVFSRLLSRNKDLQNSIESLIGEKISISALRFVSQRMFFVSTININSDEKQMNERSKERLGVELYNDLRDKYVKENTIDAGNLRNLTLLLKKIMKGEEVMIAEKRKYKLSLKERIDFVTDCILFTSRCERFHGDYFSPFKSERNSLRNVYQYYWQTLVAYTFFWLFICCYCEKKGLPEIVKIESVVNSVNGTLERMNAILNNSI